MADFFREELLSLAEASRVLPNRPHVSTLWRWSLRGIKGVRLKTLIVGGRRYTTAAFLIEFTTRLSADRETVPVASPLRDEQKAHAARRAASTF
jgi:hypothetical protein